MPLQPKLPRRWNSLAVSIHALTVLCLLLFIGAMGKSAQLGLHTWLPDAMEGPTPVSALIHAATMVTAGVFMVARLSPMFEFAPFALNVVCVVGASTAFFAATVGLFTERHQARYCLFNLSPAWLHVLCVRCLRLCRWHFPSVYACLLQSLAVPWRGVGDPRHVFRAGHAEHGRHLAAYPLTLFHDVDW